jgi:iron complex transport system ATP-binding protein
MRVEVRDVRFGYGASGPEVLHGVSLAAESGTLHGVIGPNGSGKSTLLRVIGGVAGPSSGSVSLDGQDIGGLSPRQAAQVVAAVGAAEAVIFPFSVEETVMMGRSPHLRFLASETALDVAKAREAMERTGVAHLAERRITSLSSGERQRVLIARALAQEPRVLLLDEPTAHLDVNFQVEIMELVQALAHESGITTIAVLHDLNLAGRYCDRITMLSSGQVAACGVPSEVLTEEHLLDVYGVRAIVGRRPELDRPAVFVISGSPRHGRRRAAGGRDECAERAGHEECSDGCRPGKPDRHCGGGVSSGVDDIE